MKEFELKLNNTVYTCSSSVSTFDTKNWEIKAQFNDLEINMEIPIESKVSLDKVLVFISSFDEALRQVQRDKSKELTFINQLT